MRAIESIQQTQVNMMFDLKNIEAEIKIIRERQGNFTEKSVGQDSNGLDSEPKKGNFLLYQPFGQRKSLCDSSHRDVIEECTSHPKSSREEKCNNGSDDAGEESITSAQSMAAIVSS